MICVGATGWSPFKISPAEVVLIDGSGYSRPLTTAKDILLCTRDELDTKLIMLD
jgi:hypothetical protein